MENDNNETNENLENINVVNESTNESSNENSFRPALNSYSASETHNKVSKPSFSFSRNIFVPFVSGVVGATLVLGTCFGIPSIKDSLFGSSKSPSVNITSGPSGTAISLTDYSDTATNVAEKILPSIVGIQIQYSVTSFFGGTSSATATGSGIIISEDGYILTNNHVVSSSSTSSYYQVSEAQKVTVSLYGSDETYDATIVGTDAQTDLAIIKIEATGLTAAELGDSDSVKVGEFVMAVGSPLGLSSSVTTGIVSAINRKVTDDDGNTYLAIQTDAAINSGNSGGALVNAEGKVIGINTLKLSGTGVEGIGFAIPINSTISVYQQLIQYNKVLRPYIGISGRNINEATAKKYNLVVGVYVYSIEEYSAAEIAGLKVGDVITAVNGKTVTTLDELNEIKNQYEIGDEITLTINRSGSVMDIKLKLKEAN